MQMIIQGKYDSYYVHWRECGYTGAEAVVQVQRLLWGFIPCKKTVYSDFKVNDRQNAYHYNLYRWTPNQLEDWYKLVVERYENYKEAWEKQT